jgi:hypothetical protein
MPFRNRLLKFTVLLFSVGCSSGYSPNSTTTVTTTTVVAAGLLKDINTGVQQNVSGAWATIRGTLYFVNNPATNPGHSIWKATVGVASEVVDLGTANHINGLISDARASASPSRFYFVVNGTQLWTSDGTTTTMIAQYLDGNGPISGMAIGNDVYFQLNGTGSNGKVFKSVNGATPGEIFSSGSTSFNVGVTFQPAATHMYIYDSAAPVTVFSHTGAPGAAATVISLTAGNLPTPIAVTGDDLYYQENGTFKVMKSVAGAAGGEVKDDGGVSIAGAVTLNPGTAHMYISLVATNSKIFSHTGY